MKIEKMRTLCGTILAAVAVMLSGAVFAAATDPLAGEPEGERGKGAIVLSFDDRNLADWEKAIPLFDKYGAHATFFCTGKIEGDAARVLKKLRDHGHSIGLHGLNHLNANEAFVLTSHGIHPDAKHIHMKTEWLERILATAKECGVPCLGFDEL